MGEVDQNRGLWEELAGPHDILPLLFGLSHVELLDSLLHRLGLVWVGVDLLC